MKKNILISVCIIYFFSVFNIYPQEESKRPYIKVYQIAENLYSINIQGENNIISIGKEWVFLVDANYEELAKYISEELHNLGKDKIDYILNTHWHFDHCGGNKIFGKESVIIAQTEVKKLLSRDDILLGEVQKAYPDYALPKITFEDEYNIYFNEDSIKIMALSGGHSMGDAIVYFKNKHVLHIGDIIFADQFPFCDVDHGGSVITLEKNIQIIIDMMSSDVKIVPGHGRVCSINDLKEYKEMLVKTTEIVKKEINSGKSLEEIKKANVLKEWSEWQKSFSCDDWIEYIYKSIKK